MLRHETPIPAPFAVVRGVSTRTWRSTILVPVLFSCIAIMLLVLMKRPEAMTHDFLNLYTGASFARDGRIADLYNPETVLAREQEFVKGLARVTVFSRPPWYALILAPMSMLPYGAGAFGLWVFLQMSLLGLSWVWAVRRFGRDVIRYTCLYLPPMTGIAYGQDCLVPLCILIAGYIVANKKRDFVSGLVLGMGLFKFHLFCLWPPILAVNKRWKMLSGMAAAVVLEFLLSLSLSGTSGLQAYVRFLLKGSSALHPEPRKVVSLWGILANLGFGQGAVALLCVIAVVAITLLQSRCLSTEQVFIIATIGSLAIAPHIYLYDATILLLPIWLLIFTSNDQKASTGAELFAKPYAFMGLLFLPPPLLAIGGLSVLFVLGAALHSLPQHANAFWRPRLALKPSAADRGSN